MIIQILFALLAGVLTIAAPCILPVLPILLGASVGQQSKHRPLYIVIGFIASFTALSIILSSLVNFFIRLDIIIFGHQIGPRDIAILFLAIFGLFMLLPAVFEKITSSFNGIINKASQTSKAGRTGNLAGLLLGLMLGIIWAPCAGPVLGVILTLIATQGSTVKSTILLTAYALGAGVPMLVIAYGSQVLTTKVRWLARYSTRLQQIFGVLILLLAVAMYFQYDTKIENKLAAYFPQSNLETRLVQTNPANKNNALSNSIESESGKNNSMPKIDFKNYGPAPEFTGIDHWLNSDALTMQSLRGKVVLIDFWTYSCINCIRALPYVTKWYDQYHDKGFVVIGVHTPEFAFEKVTDNVQTAIKRFNIHYPVAQDNNYGTWNAYQNQFWPAEYLIDQKGNIVYQHFGEGEYDHTENAIRQLLSYNSAVAPENGQDLTGMGSPEMYFEPARLQNLTPDQNPSLQATSYHLPTNLPLNNFALSGTWQFKDDRAELIKGPGTIRLRYHSKNVYMVASSDKPITVTVRLDGDKAREFTVQASQLYDLIKSDVSGEHTLDIIIPDAGFQAFTFTFG